MNPKLSIAQLIAPLVGALAGYLTSKGFALPPGWADAVTTGGAVVLASGWHLFEVWYASVPPTIPPPDSSVNRTLPKVLIPFLLLTLGAGAAGSLTACATAPVRSTDEGLYAAYGAYAALEETLTQGVTAGWLAKSTAVTIDAKAAVARSLLDAAKAAETSSPSSAAQDLSTAAAILSTLQAQLSAAQPKPAG